MICPKCKSAMVVVEYRKIELDYCNACQGVWFDSGELELLLKSHRVTGAEPFTDGIVQSPDARSTEEKRKCPVCLRKMKKSAIGEKRRLLIDVCRQRHGLWFDGGEIAQLVRHLAGDTHTVDDAGSEIVAFLEEVFQSPSGS